MNKAIWLSVFMFAAAASAADRCNIPAEFADIANRNGAKEAERLARNGTPRFWGVAGYAIQTPGAPGIAYCWLDAGLVEVIPGTSDVVCRGAHERFQDAAYVFATEFNRKLFEIVPALHHHSCATQPTAPVDIWRPAGIEH